MLSEIIEWYKHKKQNLLIIKIDFEKAFDSLIWDYLDHVIRAISFGENGKVGSKHVSHLSEPPYL